MYDLVHTFKRPGIWCPTCQVMQNTFGSVFEKSFIVGTVETVWSCIPFHRSSVIRELKMCRDGGLLEPSGKFPMAFYICGPNPEVSLTTPSEIMDR